MGFAHLFDVIIVWLIFCSDTSQAKPTVKHSGQYITTKRLLNNYIKHDPPTLDRPTIVLLGINVNSFYSISEQTMDYSVILYLRQRWHDPRLTFPSPDGRLHQMKMPEDYWKKIWVPDVFFRNEKYASYHDVTVPNRLLRINSTGSVWYTTKISATLSCPMKLHRYPLDTQMCPMMFESFGYTMDTMVFEWLDNAVDIDKENVQLPQFTLVHSLQRNCSQNYTSGSYPCLSVKFVLHRDIGFFIIQVYVPSMLIVILSWVSFWINIDASPARVSLGLLTVLTTTTMSGGARESLPRVSYIKAIDVWMIMCLIFVFASLIEYAVVNVVARRQVKSNASPVFTSTQPSVTSWRTSIREEPTLLGRLRKCLKRSQNVEKEKERNELHIKPVDLEASKKRARQIDKISRKFFPVSFLVFNIIYWVYLARSQQDLSW